MYEDPIHSEKRQANLMRLEAEMASCRTWLGAKPIELALEATPSRRPSLTHPGTPEVFGTREQAGYLNPDLVKRLEPFMDTCIRIMIVGEGDPLLNPRFSEIIEPCLSSGAEVSFATPGGRLTPEQCRRLVEKKLAHIQFSINAATPELYGLIHREGSFEAALRHLRALAEARKSAGGSRPLIEWSTVLMRSNAGQIAGLVRLAAGCGADHVSLKPLDVPVQDPQAREMFRHEFLHLDALKEAVDRARAEAESLGIEVYSPIVDDLAGRGTEGDLSWRQRSRRAATEGLLDHFARVEPPPPGPGAAGGTGTEKEKSFQAHIRQQEPIRCTQPWTTFYLRWNGDVLPCTKHHAAVDRLEHWSDPMEVWNSRNFRSLRKVLAAGGHPRRCRPCMESLEGRDIIEECSRVVMPVESAPEAKPEPKPEFKPDPGALVLGLGFSKYGTSLALLGGGLGPVHRPMEDLTGIVPSRFISRLSPASMRGEFYLEDGLFRELLERVLEGAEGASFGNIRYIAYNPDRSFTTHLPNGRNPALENLFPEAVPVQVDHHHGHMALAFFSSPFKAAATLVADDAGLAVNREGPVLTLGRGEGRELEILRRIPQPHNPGALFYAARVYLGLGAREEGRIAEMAAAGSDRLDKTFLAELEFPEGGGFRFRESGFLAGLSRISGADRLGQEPTEILEDRFGPKSTPGSDPEPHHLDVAHAVCRCLCDILVRLALEAHKLTGSSRLCLSGHTGLRECLERRILEETPIREIHVPLEPAGLGLAAGNALAAAVNRLGAPRPASRAVMAALSPRGEAPPPPEDLSRFRNTAIATLRHQHERLVWSWHAEKNATIPPNAAKALELLVRQNERLLTQRLENLEELRRLRKRLAPFARLKGWKRKLTEPFRRMTGRSRKKE